MKHIRGKKVLHLGCADWPFTESKVIKGTLLHQRMMTVAGELVGVDLADAGVKIMQEAGIGNIFIGNSEESLYEKLRQRFDVIIAGEILEHVLNPGLFLASIKSVFHEDSILVITTPNFAPIKRLPRLLLRNEEVHPDHVYYFSRSTLTRLLTRCGYEPAEWCAYWRDVEAISRLVNKLLRRITICRYYADGFCLVCRSMTKKT